MRSNTPRQINILYRWCIMKMGHNIPLNINLCKGNSINKSNMQHPDQIVYNVRHACAKACPNACPKIIQHLTSNIRKTEIKAKECKQTGNFLTSPVLFSALQRNKNHMVITSEQGNNKMNTSQTFFAWQSFSKHTLQN